MKILNRILNIFRESSGKEGSLTLRQKITRWYLNLFVAKKDEYYDYEEPSERKMKNKEYWIQIIEENK